MMRSVILTMSVVLSLAISHPLSAAESKAAKYKTFKSRKGSEITCPENWTVYEKDGIWTIDPPEKVAITISSYPAKGEIEKFADVVTKHTGGENRPKGPRTKLQKSNWTGYIQEFAGKTPGSSDWIVIAVKAGDVFHAITVNGDAQQIEMNREFYLKVIESFKAHEK